MHSHLGCRQTDALGRVHAAQHVPGQISHTLINLADPLSRGAQHPITKGVDREGGLLKGILGHLNAAAGLNGGACHLGKAAG